jgi:hypothetical protein
MVRSIIPGLCSLLEKPTEYEDNHEMPLDVSIVRQLKIGFEESLSSGQRSADKKVVHSVQNLFKGKVQRDLRGVKSGITP